MKEVQINYVRNKRVQQLFLVTEVTIKLIQTINTNYWSIANSRIGALARVFLS